MLFRKKFFVMLSLLSLPLLATEITHTSDGRIRAGNYEFGIVHWGKGWGAVAQNAQSVRFSGKEISAKDGWNQREGTFTVRGGTFKLRERWKNDGPNRCEVHYLLTSDTPIHTENLALLTKMPIPVMLANPPRVGKKPFVFGPARDAKKTWLRESLAGTFFEMKTSAGCLRVTGNGIVYGQDNRSYKQNIAEIRFLFSPYQSSGLKRAELKLTFELLPAALKSALSVDPANGCVRAGNYEFGIIHWGKGWGSVAQNDQSVKFSGNPVTGEDGWARLDGTFAVRGGTFQLQESWKADGPNRCEVHYLLASGTPIHTENLVLRTLMPIPVMLANPPKVGETPFTFGKVHDAKKTWLRESLGGTDFTMKTQAGLLRITGNGIVYGQDNRSYKQNQAEIRFLFSPYQSSGLKRAELKLTFELLPENR